MAEYRKYDPAIIEMVRKSRNPNLFPHLAIPRSTAMGWINGKKKKVKLEGVNYDLALLKRIEDLESELEKERAKVLFLQTLIRKLAGFRELIAQKKNREVFVDAVLEYTKWLSKSELCRLVVISTKTFFRYKAEIRGCERISLKKCRIMSANQLTFVEQMKIYRLAMDEKYRVGIRANRINEIWHIDITEFRCVDGGKIYLQVLMDNFSRKIIH